VGIVTREIERRMRSITTTGYFVLVAAMIIFVAFSGFNYLADEDYRKTLKQNAITATHDRQSIKTMIQVGNDQKAALENNLFAILSQVYYLANQANLSQARGQAILADWNHTFDVMVDNQVAIGKHFNISGVRDR